MNETANWSPVPRHQHSARAALFGEKVATARIGRSPAKTILVSQSPARDGRWSTRSGDRATGRATTNTKALRTIPFTCAPSGKSDQQILTLKTAINLDPIQKTDS